MVTLTSSLSIYKPSLIHATVKFITILEAAENTHVLWLALVQLVILGVLFTFLLDALMLLKFVSAVDDAVDNHDEEFD